MAVTVKIKQTNSEINLARAVRMVDALCIPYKQREWAIKVVIEQNLLEDPPYFCGRCSEPMKIIGRRSQDGAWMTCPNNHEFGKYATGGA